MTINFCVVFRINDHFFIPRRAEECEGIKPTEAWLLGKARTKNEIELYDAAINKTVDVCRHQIP